MGKISSYPSDTTPTSSDYVLGNQASGPTTSRFPIANLPAYTNNFSNPYKFSVYRNTAWTDGNGTYVQVIFDAVVFDTGTNFNTTTGKFTAPIAGFYQFNWSISKSQTSNTAMLSSLFVNAEATCRASSDQQFQGASTGGAATSGSALIQLALGDTVMIKSYGSGGAGAFGLSTFGSTSFSGFLVSAT